MASMLPCIILLAALGFHYDCSYAKRNSFSLFRLFRIAAFPGDETTTSKGPTRRSTPVSNLSSPFNVTADDQRPFLVSPGGHFSAFFLSDGNLELRESTAAHPNATVNKTQHNYHDNSTVVRWSSTWAGQKNVAGSDIAPNTLINNACAQVIMRDAASILEHAFHTAVQLMMIAWLISLAACMPCIIMMHADASSHLDGACDQRNKFSSAGCCYD
jgi:hypothetical protein